MKRLYVHGVRACRRVLQGLGVIDALDRASTRSRFALWVRSLFAIYDADALAALGVPWWTFRATDAVGAFLSSRRAPVAFEWGSGASTRWLAGRCARVVSVEHDAAWHAVVVGDLDGNAEVVLAEPVPASTSDPASGVVRSSKRGFAGLDFADYVAAIEDAGGPFDLIVVDGRARSACLLAALPHLKSDGMIVVDDTERRRYRRTIATLDGFVVTPLVGLNPCLPYPSSTTLLTPRPSSEPRAAAPGTD
jgi:hypothetical protein